MSMPTPFYISENFYKDVENVKEIQAVFKEYEIEEIAKDIEQYSAMYGDLGDEHPHIPNLEKVMERMLSFLLNE